MKNIFKRQINKIVLIGLGAISLTWFLIRVIPKPSRAAYPCMKASYPFISAFIIYVASLLSFNIHLKDNFRKIFSSKNIILFPFILLILFSINGIDPSKSRYNNEMYYASNQPVGKAIGVNPGRVVWIHEADATNGSLTNADGDYWFMDKNCNQVIVDSMLTSGIKSLASKDNISSAWDALMRDLNKRRGIGDVGYEAGEKFAIKINLTNSCCFTAGNDRVDASPQLVFSILQHLIENIGVPQSDIWIGDNYRFFRNEYWNKCHTKYPDVHYVDEKGLNGREKTIPSATQVLKFSDGVNTSSLPQHYIDAQYIINIGLLKSHDAGGITLTAKNHMGSILDEGVSPSNQSAGYMHYALPVNNPNSGQYRHLVDLMSHKDLGGKTLLYIIDGLWGGKNWEGVLEQWQMPPFNGDYPSSVFLSQDAVAIESVGYDFLLAEYLDKPAEEKYPYMAGVDDYLKQAADSTYWPDGISYDPEGDGTIISSLGVYEHWNNSVNKQYSRNIGAGTGIELVFSEEPSSNANITPDILKTYPNPFSGMLTIESPFSVSKLKVTNILGQEVFSSSFSMSFIWDGHGYNKVLLPKGTYFITVVNNDDEKEFVTKSVIYTH